MEETQFFEDELKEANEQKPVLFDRIKELKTLLIEETQAKDGKLPFIFFLAGYSYTEYILS
jgi:hypothetical protein